MMLRIAKRRRKDILRSGAKIISEGYIRERGWKRKDCGFGVKIEHPSGMIVSCAGRNPLAAYQIALEWALSDGNPQYTEYNLIIPKMAM